MSWDDLQLRRYLLGDLTDKDTEDLDMRVISDETSRAALKAAEVDLIEDYLEGNLPAGDRRLFIENFLISNERREELESLRSLKEYAARESKRFAETGVNGRWSFGGLFTRLRPLSVAVAVLVVGVFSFAVWKVFFSERSTALEEQYAALNQADLGDASQRSSKIQLASGQLRDQDARSVVSAATLSDPVLFQLIVPYRPAHDSGFRVELMSGDRKLFTIARARVYSTPAGNEVRILMPRSVLVKGQDRLIVTDNENPDLVQTYHFLVQ